MLKQESDNGVLRIHSVSRSHRDPQRAPGTRRGQRAAHWHAQEPPHGWDDYKYWLAADRATLERINRLIDDALRDPTDGVGKPEPLRHLLAGAWSRRISEEHRLVHLVDDEDVVILQARFHYR